MRMSEKCRNNNKKHNNNYYDQPWTFLRTDGGKTWILDSSTVTNIFMLYKIYENGKLWT